MRQARHLGYITGLPDAYGRGRIIGDYRRCALYGIDRLIEQKQQDHDGISSRPIMSEENIRLAEEVSNQIVALKEIKKMAEDMDTTFPSLQLTSERRFSGPTLHIWQASKRKMERLCLSAEFLPSWTSMRERSGGRKIYRRTDSGIHRRLYPEAESRQTS